MDMKYFDAFSGYGGFSLGIQKAYVGTQSADKESEQTKSEIQLGGIGSTLEVEHGVLSSDQWRERPVCIGFSEIDKYAIQIYQKHFPTHKPYGDITKLDPSTLPDFDLFVGGFPCQAFSIAGKRAGFEDTRGTLIYDVLRIVKEKHPRLVLLENVKGLLSHDSGRTFKTIITSLAELGYAVEWQVLNAKNFGVPQNRERVFIIGHLGGFGGRQVFPIEENNSKTIVQLNQPKHSNDRLYGSDGISPALNTMQGGNRQPFVKIPEATKLGYAIAKEGDSINLSVPNSKTRRGRVGGGIAQTLDTGMQQYTICRPVLTPDRLEKRQNGRRFKEDGEPSFTLTGQDKHGIYDGMKIRRLTPTECERLMGLPDGWTEGISDTQRYKLCGNGVVVNVVEEIIKRITPIKEKNMKKKKKIVHRHKWEYDYEDCCRCGGGEVRWCECGEFQEMNYKPKVSKKTPLKRKNK